MSQLSIENLMLNIGKNARSASNFMMRTNSMEKNCALNFILETLIKQRSQIKNANEKDLDLAFKNGLSQALLDRLTLSDKTLDLMAESLNQIINMPDPIGHISETSIRPNGIKIAKMCIPLGVIGIIYESRPNVTIDAAALSLKSGNAVILRGGSEALQSNIALGSIITAGLLKANLPDKAVQLISIPDRNIVSNLITMTEYIDVIIPRGGKNLIAKLEQEARVPLIKHLHGNCHVYIDSFANQQKAYDVAINAKTYRYGICGSMETLLIHTEIAKYILPRLKKGFASYGVELRGCEQSRKLVSNISIAKDLDWETEYLGPILAVRIVDSLDQAIDHINKWSSGHTESIVTQDLDSAQKFQRDVDSSSVYVNLPTCFADGYEYGLGSEIGISTNRLHVRGPVGLKGLTTSKWILTGSGQIRT